MIEMELRNKLSFGAISMDHLLEDYFDRDKIFGYCKTCPNYEKNWSCPPHQFDEKLFLKEFKYIHLIGRQYEVPQNDIRKIRDPKLISEYCTQKTEAMKVMTWKTLLELENDVEGAIGLIPGSCPICQAQGMVCTRESNQACRYPNLMRYSLESLGFSVTDLIKYEVGMTIKWSENQRLPDQLTSVAGILCNAEIPQEVLKKYFPDQKKSWVKYDQGQLDTGFKTSVLIKASETIHGDKEALPKASVIDEEIPAYKPHKTWLNYKGQVEDEDLVKKPGAFKVTIQGEEDNGLETDLLKGDDKQEDQIESEPETSPDLEIGSEPEIVLEAEEAPEKSPDESHEQDSEEIKYQWLGFKGQVEDEDLPRRPIPKMVELILEEGDQASDPEPVGEDQEVSKSPPIEAVKVVKKTGPSLEKTISDLVQAATRGDEDEDQNYKWLGFKGRLDEDEESF